MRKRMRTAAAVMAALLLAGCGAKNVSMDEAKVELGDYTGIEISMDSMLVTDDDVTGYLEWMLYYYNQDAVSDRTVVEDGDTVYATVYIYDEEGGLLEDDNGHEGYIYIGTETTYPELEQGIIGANVGDTLEIPITFPDPYEYDESLSGMQATGKVTIEHIRETEELKLETLTDEQVSEAFGTDTVDELYESIRSELEANKEETMRTTAYEAISDYLLETCTVDPFPDLELADRINKYMEQVEEMCSSYYDMTFAEYCEQIGMTEEEYREEASESLSETIKLELIFTAIADVEGIDYEESAYESYINSVIEEYGYESDTAVYEDYGEEYVRNAFRIEYVIDWLIENADIVYTAESADE